ncbi:MAG TPA: hypothetical protein ENI62_12420 [Gammaproteobacteria bacterium]|nr:hypothetical protein [Gammaproteobacteria bacterium]
MIVVAGPRQVGKTTMVRQALSAYPSTFVATDLPLPDVVDATPKGLSVFTEKFKGAKQRIVGEGGVSPAEFLSGLADDWLE